MEKIIFCGFLFVAFSLTAQEFDKAKLDSLFSAIGENQKGMGSVSIFSKGEEVYQNSIGFSDLENNLRNESSTKFRIGSISKTFTATIIMQLVEEEKLRLNTKLSEFYPNVPNAAEITIEDLLRHQSGLYNFTSSPEYLEYLEEPKTKEQLLEIFTENGTAFSPREKNEYSNTNYVLLSFIAEDVENDIFDNILQNRIVQPLGLKNTYYGGKINSENQEAFSYTKKGEWIPATETDLSIPKGAGGIVSTPYDLNIFFTALFNGKVIEPETLEQMKTLNNGYGMGLFSYPYDEKTLYGHTGGIDGFSSMAVYERDSDLAVTYISNAGEFPTNDIVLGVLSIYYGKEYAVPAFEPKMEIPEEELQKYTGTYSAEGFPLKLEVFVEDGVLMGRGTGQQSFPMEAYEQDKFQFIPAGLKLHFSPEEEQLTILQGGGTHVLKKE
ncbi:serine hydrolase domain-containing protein [Salinimicrobium sp. GXAS 041]|uniref:serine hydrolase domain-containing protein n=1 Tax=Salinimicrobium sp. GXAS 041 TaxID=3400806 RepID=UPI003C7089FB